MRPICKNHLERADLEKPVCDITRRRWQSVDRFLLARCEVQCTASKKIPYDFVNRWLHYLSRWANDEQATKMSLKLVKFYFDQLFIKKTKP